MRTLILIAVLVGVGSTPGIAPIAFAADHYIEIWNPPEARMPPAHRPAPKPRARPLAARRPQQAVTRKVAERAAGTANAARPPAPRATAKPTMRNLDIPRKMGPDGQVLRVSDPLPASGNRSVSGNRGVSDDRGIGRTAGRYRAPGC